MLYLFYSRDTEAPEVKAHVEGHSSRRGKTRLPMQVSRDHQSAGAKVPAAGLGRRGDLIYCRHSRVWIGVRMLPSCLWSGLTFYERLIGFHLGGCSVAGCCCPCVDFSGLKIFLTVGNCKTPNGLFLKLLCRRSLHCVCALVLLQ